MTTLEEALARGHGRERSFNCPVHGDKNPSASVNVEKGVWVCYACGASGRVGDDVVIPDSTILDLALDLIGETEVRTYPESWLDQFNSPSEYWQGRFTAEAIKKFRLGLDHSNGLPCYPLRDIDQSVLGVVYRSNDPNRKYLYPYGIKISRLLYNASYDHHPVLTLTEGATDTIAAWEAGFDAVACFGRTLSDYQVSLIQKIGPRVVLLGHDQDRAGHRAAWEAQETLEKVGIPVIRLRWGSGKDLASLPIEDRKKILIQGLAL